MKLKRKLFLIIVLLIILSKSIISGKVYLTLEKALKETFPKAENFTKIKVKLSKKEKEKIKKMAKVKFVKSFYYFYRANNGKEILGYGISDNVKGKSLPITYFVALDYKGNIKEVQILIFRESRGYEVKNKVFLKQFYGKNIKSKLKLRKDIKNISGATISAKAITEGVRIILAIFEEKIKK